MASDFSTDADFQRKLDWMSEFVREQIWPLETVVQELGWDGLMRAMRPLQADAARKDIALIKFFGAQVLHDVVDRALQAHGSLGYSTDLALEAMYRHARAARIYDGPDEVHRASVARQVLRGYDPPADNVPSEHVPSRREAARERFAELLDAVTAND